MAGDSALELPDELCEPMRHCRFIVGACSVLRSLALRRWRDALEWDDEFYDDVPDVDPSDVDYMFGKFEVLLEELKQELDDAEMGRWDDGQYIAPIVPFSAAVHAAHLMTREGRDDAHAGDLSASTYHELALKIPAGAVEFWRECKFGVPSMRLDFEHGPTNSDWDDHFPDVDYRELSLRIRDEAHLAWAKMSALSPRPTSTETSHPEAGPDDAVLSIDLSVPKRPQASPPELFPQGIPENRELAECILMLAAQRDGTKADYDILLPRFQGQGPLVEAMQAEIRRTRHEGIHTLRDNPKRRKRSK